jgi:prepilin-type processing-associated H-X9-DG protein
MASPPFHVMRPLPFLEQQKLFDQFDLTEAWDGPHNRELLDRLPAIYWWPGARHKEDRKTTLYRVFVGPGTVFEGRALTLTDITQADGTAYTILVVEAGEPVPWTKPEELTYDPDKPLPPLGGLFKRDFRPFSPEYRTKAFSALFVDGHVEPVPLPEGKHESLVRSKTRQLSRGRPSLSVMAAGGKEPYSSW